MEPCVVETGLLRKKPCGHTSITKCANCEIPLCAQHAVAQLTAAQKKTGAFLCKECDDARRQHEKTMAALPKSAPPPAAKKAPEPPKAPAKDAGGQAGGDIPDTIEYRPAKPGDSGGSDKK